MPFVIGVRGVHIQVYLFPYEGGGLLRGEGVMDRRPYFIPVDGVSEFLHLIRG